MKTFFTLFLGALCSFQAFAQTFFVEHPDSSIKSNIELWVSSNGYQISTNKTTAQYIIECKEIKRPVLKKDFIYISLIDNKGVVVGQTKTVYRKNSTKSFVKLAELELKPIVKKALASANPDIFRASFGDTLVSILRSKTEIVTTRSTISFTGQAGDTIVYYFAFENEPVKAKFKNYTGSKYNGTLPTSNMIEVDILPDTTIKTTMTYRVQLFYKKKGDSDFKRDKFFTIKAVAQEIIPPVPFHKNELILFAGTTYDHFNPSNKISGLSIEPMLTTMVNKHLWLRFGVFFHPNFSRDTTARDYVAYYTLNKEQLISNQSKVGKYTQRVGIGQRVQSIGFYTDFILITEPKKSNEKGIRISPTFHVEMAKRILTPTSSFSATSIDTVTYYSSTMRSALRAAKPDSSFVTVERSISNQFITTLSAMFEVNLNNVYIYFQPMFGHRFEYMKSASRDGKIRGSSTSGYKFSIRYKELISLSIDHRDFLTRNEYLNISFGVPITISTLFKKDSK